MTTLRRNITDALIKRSSSDTEITQLRDPRHPVLLRYHKRRDRGSWYLVRYSGGRTRREKLGDWPSLTAKRLLEQLPNLLAARATEPSQATPANSFATLGEVLEWYDARAQADRQLSDDRKANTATAIRRHLVPLIGHLDLEHITRSALDDLFFQPQQQAYELSTVRSQYYIAKAATARATRLGWLGTDPLAPIRWRDFTSAPVRVRAGRLRPADVAALLRCLVQALDTQAQACALVVMMLAHGTRIGETRRAAWQHIEPDEWLIPGAHTKTRTEHRLPLTDTMRRFLRAYRCLTGSRYLFRAARSPRPLSPAEASAQVRLLSRQAWSAHDLRKVARTRWMDQGTDYMVGEMLLNHALSRIDSAYIHTHAQTQKRAALETYHQWLIEQGLGDVIDKIERLTDRHNSDPQKTTQMPESPAA